MNTQTHKQKSQSENPPPFQFQYFEMWKRIWEIAAQEESQAHPLENWEIGQLMGGN